MLAQVREKDVWWTQGLALEDRLLAVQGPREESSALQLPEIQNNQILEAPLA